MLHKPIVIHDISWSVHQRICFENFTTHISVGKRIVIMGSNGSGKSTLLQIIQGMVLPTTGSVTIPESLTFGYVPQTITDHPLLSGGQRFNKSLSQALSIEPDILLLDEPTNHLDAKNKKSLVRMLASYTGTLIVVSHDPELLTLNWDEIWHIEHENVTVFAGKYNDYLKDRAVQKQAIEQQREQLQKEKRLLKKMVQKEHQRAAQSSRTHKDEHDKVLLGAMKEAGSRSTGKNLKRLAHEHERIQAGLAHTFVHQTIQAKFNLDTRKVSMAKALVSIIDGSCGYADKKILQHINLQLRASERIALFGDNGSGKSTFLKALLHDPQVVTSGEWHLPLREDIGYLDQHYSTLAHTLSVFEVIQQKAPQWSDAQIRKHLNDFLFSTPPQVHNKVLHLSGGEKARLSLACIAAQSPVLLLLDEVTNNIDQETRQHILGVLRNYPGALIIVSHDEAFVQELGVSAEYEIGNGVLTLNN